MFTTKDDAMTKGGARGEMVTPSFTGNLRGDPRAGRTRLLTNNICEGTCYYLGVQANGSKFLDREGGWGFNGDVRKLFFWFFFLTRGRRRENT